MAKGKPGSPQDGAVTQSVSHQGEDAQLHEPPEPAIESGSTGGGWRKVVSLTLVVLAIGVLVAGVVAAWAKTTIASEDRFVATFSPIPKNEAVATALSERLAEELIINSGLVQQIERLLPSGLTILAIPVTEGIYTLTVDTAQGIIVSNAFTGIWETALRVSHGSASAVLSTGGKVAIDLNTAAEEVVSELEARGVTLLSDVEIELPEIVLFQNDQLEQAADALGVVDTLGWFVPLIALLLFAGALWVSLDRRRTAAIIGFGTAFGLLVTLVVVRVIRRATVGNLDDETQRSAAEAVWDTTLRFYLQAMWSLIVLALLVGGVAWVMGPSERAGRIRGWWDDAIARRRGEDAAVPTSGFAGFVASWRRPLQWGALILGLMFLLLGPDPSVWSVVVIALVVVAAVTAVEFLAGPEPSGGPAVDAEDEVAANQ